MFDFGGPLSFGAAADFGYQIREKSKGPSKVMVLDFSKVPFLDVSAARAVQTIAEDGKVSNKLVYISGMTDQIRTMLTELMGDIVPRGSTLTRVTPLPLHQFVEVTEADPSEGGAAEPSPV